MNSTPDSRSSRPLGEFVTTHWSLVLDVGRSDEAAARSALCLLCERYWYPLYVYVRRRIPDANEAQDLTQDFFSRLIEKNVLASASPERGRFRSFLLTSMKNFLANARDQQRAHKRGGGRPLLSLDFEAGESRFRLEPAHELSAERIFEKQWVLTLLELVLARLHEELIANGKARHFEVLQPALTAGSPGWNAAAAAAELGLSEEAARQAAHRLRKRYRELLRAELARTVATPQDVDDEMRNLVTLLQS